MKKVRYAIGALGMAPVLAMPLNHAAVPGAHVSGKAAKRVNLVAALRPQNPALTCHHSAHHSKTDNNSEMDMFADWNGADCVFAVRGEYDSPDSSLVMRVTVNSRPDGHIVYLKIDSFGQVNEKNFSTNWTVSKINHSGMQVCASILRSAATIAGPNCVTT
jgi:hypothetical protein